MSASAADRDQHPPVDIVARGVGFTFRPYCGIVSDLMTQDQGRRISMMHKAPWVGKNIQLPNDAPPHQACLEGDFFCAPFSDASAQAAPLHGWPANGLWRITPGRGSNEVRATLPHLVNGAPLTKTLLLQDDHPFLYQSHIFHGGFGRVSAANHAMLSLPNGGFLRYSPKKLFQTPSTAPEPDPSRGRSCLRYPAQTSDPRNFPAAAGDPVDITHYPFGPAHDDFVIALETPDSPLGWTAVTRPHERDLYLSLRHPRRTPMTMLWHSNGGRDYAPWSGRHLHCLGIEDGIATAFLDPKVAAGLGDLVMLKPDTAQDLRHITGCIAWPSGEPILSVEIIKDQLVVTGDQGAQRHLPILGDFLAL